MRLNLHESVHLLKNLKNLSINGFHEINFPESLIDLKNLKKIVIYSKDLMNLPEVLFKLTQFHNIIIDSRMSDAEKNKIEENYDYNNPHIIVKCSANTILEGLELPSHISNFTFVAKNLPQEMIFRSKVKKLVIIEVNNASYSFLNGDLYTEELGAGNYFLKSNDMTFFPTFTVDPQEIENLIIQNRRINQIPEWIFQSPHIKQLLISQYQLNFNRDFQSIEKGRFEISINDGSRLNAKNITAQVVQARLELPSIRNVPEFVCQIKNIQHLIITSRNLDDFVGSFGKNHANRIEIKSYHQFALTNALNSYTELTHLQLDGLNFGSFPADLKFPRLKLARLTENSNLNRLPHFIAHTSLKIVHIYKNIDQSYITDFWNNNDDNRLEVLPSVPRFFFVNNNNFTHLIVSGYRMEIDTTDFDLKSIKHMRFEDLPELNKYFQYFSNADLIEINIANVRSVPDWILNFINIKKILLTTEEVPFQEEFFNSDVKNTLKLKIHNEFDFESLSNLSAYSHACFVIHDINFLSNNHIILINNSKPVRILKTTDPERFCNKYLGMPDPGYRLIVFNTECVLPGDFNSFVRSESDTFS